MDSADEQAAQVRRELDSRLHTAEAMAKVGPKVHKAFLILTVASQKLPTLWLAIWDGEGKPTLFLVIFCWTFHLQIICLNVILRSLLQETQESKIWIFMP